MWKTGKMVQWDGEQLQRDMIESTKRQLASTGTGNLKMGVVSQWNPGEGITTQLLMLPYTNRRVYLNREGHIVIEQEGAPFMVIHPAEWQTIADFVLKTQTLDKL